MFRVGSIGNPTHAFLLGTRRGLVVGPRASPSPQKMLSRVLLSPALCPQLPPSISTYMGFPQFQVKEDEGLMKTPPQSHVQGGAHCGESAKCMLIALGPWEPIWKFQCPLVRSPRSHQKPHRAQVLALRVMGKCKHLSPLRGVPKTEKSPQTLQLWGMCGGKQAGEMQE